MALKITSIAAKEIKSIMAANEMDAAKTHLRVGVRGGGCAGFQYSLDLTEEIHKDDETFKMDGIQIVCDSKSYLYLNGAIVDFQDGIMGRGFVFDNPNATTTCGCNQSFSA